MRTTNYREMLIERSRKASEASPFVPEKPLNHIQLQNHRNIRAWRERLFVNSLMKSWLKEAD